MTKLYYSYVEKEKSHEMLFHILARYRNVFAKEDDLVFNENGKPGLGADKPHFSISHTSGIVMIAVSDFPVGIDVEPTGRKINDYEKLTKRFYAEEEFPKIKCAFDFLAVWTKKESAVKYFGGNITENLSDIVFDRDTPKGRRELAGASTFTFRLGDYVYSVTAREKPTSPLLLL